MLGCWQGSLTHREFHVAYTPNLNLKVSSPLCGSSSDSNRCSLYPCNLGVQSLAYSPVAYTPIELPSLYPCNLGVSSLHVVQAQIVTTL